MNSRDFYSVYPPVSQLVFATASMISGLSGGGWKSTYYAIKVLLLLLDVGTVLLLIRLISPSLALLYAWNPVVLVETAAQPHTEVILLFLLVTAIYLVPKNENNGLGVILALATWVKLYPILFIPFFYKRFSIRFAGEFILTGLLVWYPFFISEAIPNMYASLELYTTFYEFNAGLYYSTKYAISALTGVDYSKTIGPALQVTFLLSLPVVWMRSFVKQWPIAKSIVVLLGVFLVLSTTVHPWYLTPLLGLMLLIKSPFPRLAFWWLATCSVGTYLLYTSGPYYPWVIAAWFGFLVFLSMYTLSSNVVLRRRAVAKAKRIRPFLPAVRPLELLDLGCAEGFVADELATGIDADVQLLDVEDMNRTGHKFEVYDGHAIPFSDNRFDFTLLYFVLHHTKDQERVLNEAIRVTGGKLIIVESIYDTWLDKLVLTLLDRLANRIRSLGRMNSQEKYLRFSTEEEWRKAIGPADSNAIFKRFGHFPHKQLLICLTKKSIRS